MRDISRAGISRLTVQPFRGRAFDQLLGTLGDKHTVLPEHHNQGCVKDCHKIVRGVRVIAKRFAMAHYVGVYYPQALDDNGVPGYVLSQAQLMITAGGLVGKPITYEHRGIQTAVEHVNTSLPRVSGADVAHGLSHAVSADPASSPVGVVTDAWQSWSGDWLCAFTISPRCSRACVP